MHCLPGAAYLTARRGSDYGPTRGMALRMCYGISRPQHRPGYRHTWAGFPPHLEQRICGASSVSVTFQPNRRAGASGVLFNLSRLVPLHHLRKLRLQGLQLPSLFLQPTSLLLHLLEKYRR